MKDLYDQPPSSRGAPHAEANANTEAANTPTSLASEEPTPSEQTQVPQSPQSLSLQVDGLIDHPGDKSNSSVAYVESSERGSDTSADGRRPELQSASTFTDSLPSSWVNDSTQSMELDTFDAPSENAPALGTYQKSSIEPRDASSHTIPVNGNGETDGAHHAVKDEDASHDLLPPLRSSTNLKSRSGNGTNFTPGHKRTATGDIKAVSSGIAALHSADINGGARRRSKSTGASVHGSRIAQLSVHIRTRLSYAAAKIEKSRQSRDASVQLPFREIDRLASLPSSSSPRAPNDTHTVPASPKPSYSQHQPRDPPSLYPSHHRSQSAISSPTKPPAISKLAPPVDIIFSNGDTRRRRPHPNMNPMSSDRSPYARHRRHHSHQEPPAARLNGSPSVVGPGAPSLTPSSHAPTSTQGGSYRPRTHSENTLMEQDAIETLLFMSSPENSGYRSGSRPLQPPATQNSLNDSLYSSQNGVGVGHSHSARRDKPQSQNTKFGLEARAGDEIDRLLDQMDSDSEDEGRYMSHRQSTARTGRGHPR